MESVDHPVRCLAGVLGPRARVIRWALLILCPMLLLSLAPPAVAVESGSTTSGTIAPQSTAPAPSASISAIPASRAASRLAVITIEGEINLVTAKSFQRRLQAAIDGKADGIVIDLDTPGGEVGAVLEICTAIKRSPVQNTIAWVNPTAYSGGAIIALACREIVLAPGATMGDAAPVAANPIQFAQGLQATERQKILAPLLAEVVESARLRGYDEKLVQGFLTLGVELWRIRDKQTGDEYFVDEGEYRTIFGRDPTRGRPHVASGSATNAPPTDQPGDLPKIDPDAPTPSNDPNAFRPASPSLTSDAFPDSLAISAPSTRPTFSQPEPDRYEVIEYATDGRTLLTLKADDLRRYGFAVDGVTITTDDELKGFTGAQHLVRLDQNWSEDLVSFMTQGVSSYIIRGVLIIVFLMAMFIEMSMPGVGLPGLIALLALVGLILPPMLIGASSWWALGAILGGVALIMLELFVLPGFGIPGILGLLLLFGGLVGTFASAGQMFPGVQGDNGSPLAWAGSIVLLAIFVAGVGVYFFTRYTNKFPIAGKLVLATTSRSDDEGGGMLAAMAPGGPSESGGPVPLGAVGRTLTPLRPAGSAEFGDKLVDVVSEFGFVEAGQTVRVTTVTQYRVAVERIEEPGNTSGGSRAS